MKRFDLSIDIISHSLAVVNNTTGEILLAIGKHFWLQKNKQAWLAWYEG